MRSSYHEEMNDVLERLLEMARLVEVAIHEAGASLLEPDLARAEAVVSNDAQLDALHEELEYRYLSLLALQAPVAGELRLIVSGIRVDTTGTVIPESGELRVVSWTPGDDELEPVTLRWRPEHDHGTSSESSVAQP